MTASPPAADLSKLRINRDDPPPALKRALGRVLWITGAAVIVIAGIVLVSKRGSAVPVQIITVAARGGDENNAGAIAKAIDDQFRNSSAATKTGTEQAFQASFATMLGNVSFLMGIIGTAVVFAILLVTANAMMMSARERTAEVAVMKTIGFSNRTLFGLVLAEAGFIALVGSALGLGFAKLLYPVVNFNGFGFLPGFNVTTMTMAWGALLAILLMLASGLVPAVRAARLPIVQALRRVE